MNLSLESFAKQLSDDSRRSTNQPRPHIGKVTRVQLNPDKGINAGAGFLSIDFPLVKKPLTKANRTTHIMWKPNILGSVGFAYDKHTDLVSEWIKEFYIYMRPHYPGIQPIVYDYAGVIPDRKFHRVNITSYNIPLTGEMLYSITDELQLLEQHYENKIYNGYDELAIFILGEDEIVELLESQNSLERFRDLVSDKYARKGIYSLVFFPELSIFPEALSFFKTIIAWGEENVTLTLQTRASGKKRNWVSPYFKDLGIIDIDGYEYFQYITDIKNTKSPELLDYYQRIIQEEEKYQTFLEGVV